MPAPAPEARRGCGRDHPRPAQGDGSRRSHFLNRLHLIGIPGANGARRAGAAALQGGVVPGLAPRMGGGSGGGLGPGRHHRRGRRRLRSRAARTATRVADLSALIGMLLDAIWRGDRRRDPGVGGPRRRLGRRIRSHGRPAGARRTRPLTARCVTPTPRRCSPWCGGWCCAPPPGWSRPARASTTTRPPPPRPASSRSPRGGPDRGAGPDADVAGGPARARRPRARPRRVVRPRGTAAVRCRAIAAPEAGDRLRRALSWAAGALPAAAWIEGFLEDSGTVLIHGEACSAWSTPGSATWHPRPSSNSCRCVRRTFATLAAPERRRIGEILARPGGPSLDTAAGSKTFDAERAARVLPILRLLLGPEPAPHLRRRRMSGTDPLDDAERLRRWPRAGRGRRRRHPRAAVRARPRDRRGDGRPHDSDRTGGLGASAPSVPRWLGDIRDYFPASVVQVMQRDAFERLDLKRMLAEPECWRRSSPT